MSRCPLACAAVCCALVAVPGSAAAAPSCGAGGRAVVELVLEVDPPDRFVGTTLEKHLRAELGAREIDVCIAPAGGTPPPRPIATVTLHIDHRPDGAFLATIRIGDLIMDKRLERTLDLGRIPRDGQPLAVAAATDELLRAGWVELTIPDAPPPVVAPPPAVLRAIGPPRPKTPPRSSVVEIGAVATGTGLEGGRVGVGGKAWIGAWVLSRLGLQLRFGADAGLPRSSRDGSTHLDTLGPGAGVMVSLPGHDAPLGVRFEAGADLLRVHLVGTAAGAAAASSATLWTGMADATVRGWARTGPIFWTLGIGALAALHGVAATDNGVTTTEVTGFGGKVDAGLGYSFR
jgi:hypothetical protein